MKAGSILIVEDDHLWQEFLQEPLKTEYSLTVVSGEVEAKEALDAAKARGEPFDVVTVDIGLDSDMPSVHTGEHILAFVSQNHPGTKCIVVTGLASVNAARLRDYFKEFKVFDYVGKNEFDLNRFKQIVDKAFDFHGYRILGELGRGGMSTVYKAFDPQNDNRVVALKVLHHDPRLSPDETARRLARFKQEVETIRRLVHPNIVAVYDYSATEGPEGDVFFVMEYLSGRTLEAVLATGMELSKEQIIEIGAQLCDALAYAHAQQIVHRDVKPSNIIILQEGQIKVTDFGIAKVLDMSTPLTGTDELIGTLDYMAPEQMLNTKGVDHRADIYATGVVLYEMLSSRKPYKDPMLKLQQEPIPLQEIVPGLSEGLAHIVMKALTRAPSDRYQTASEMAEALRVSLIKEPA
jgi:serine/threonine protein kinase